MGTASLKVLPSAAASFGTYELVRVWLTRWEERQALEKARQCRAERRQRDRERGLPCQRRLTDDLPALDEDA